MKLKFLKSCRLELTEGYDEKNDVVHTKNESFKKGEIVEVDIVETDDKNKTMQIQFGDGRVAYGVPQSTFEVIDGFFEILFNNR